LCILVQPVRSSPRVLASSGAKWWFMGFCIKENY